jgi:hypothetical protein
MPKRKNGAAARLRKKVCEQWKALSAEERAATTFGAYQKAEAVKRRATATDSKALPVATKSRPLGAKKKKTLASDQDVSSIATADEKTLRRKSTRVVKKPGGATTSKKDAKTRAARTLKKAPVAAETDVANVPTTAEYKGEKRARQWYIQKSEWDEHCAKQHVFVVRASLDDAHCFDGLDVTGHTEVAVDPATHNVDVLYAKLIVDKSFERATATPDKSETLSFTGHLVVLDRS